jgi:hypothetical protein
MNPDVPNGYDSCYVPMRYGDFGAASTDNTMDLFSKQRAFDPFTLETPPDTPTDESMSPHSSIFDINDHYDSTFFDKRPVSMLNPVLQVGPATLSTPDQDYQDYLDSKAYVQEESLYRCMDMLTVLYQYPVEE